MKTLGVIPARYGSTRLPAKALAAIGDKTVLQRVWERASQAKKLTRVVVATDHAEIESLARSFGAEVVMTSPDHLTGSDRVAEVARILAGKGEQYSLIANVQGDMPFIEPAVIDQTVEALANAPAEFGMATVVSPLMDEQEFLRVSVVKCIFDSTNGALYFSRSPIPFRRDPERHQITESEPYGYKHFGLYVFRPAALEQLTNLPSGRLERREALEQLRALENGIRIKVVIVPYEVMARSIEIDTPEDLARANASIR
jgi:3-deoxy-manno-octulosonate cytidylyltransferase (CMP-KDO synthetase)